jgi:regulator of protease activity HflC (stomatin/prohibitin superfamily)
VVLRFGEFVREVIDIGFDRRRGSTMSSIPQESLMLTGDENIVDVDFSVLWKVKPNHVGDYLFNVHLRAWPRQPKRGKRRSGTS